MKLRDRIIEFVNFDAMRGKNDWADYNKCFIIHLPNLPFHNYVYQYLYYGRGELSQEDLKLQKIDTNFGFYNNDIIENLRLTDVVSSVYQGLKRVNRAYGKNDQCELYVVTNNERVQNLIIKQFKYLKGVERVKIFEREYDNSNREKNSLERERGSKIDIFFNNMSVGEVVKKKTIREHIEVNDNKQFIRALDYLGGVDYLKSVGIETKGHSYVKVA